jgi:hypothetical protein
LRFAAWISRHDTFLLFLIAGLPSIVGFLTVAWLLAPRGFLFEDDDPLAYYLYLRSAVHDGDIDFTNDYQFFQKRGAKLDFAFHRRHPLTGKYDNQYTVGTPLLNAPIYATANLFLHSLYRGDSSLEHFPWFLDQMIYSCSNLILGLFGLWFTFRFCSVFFDQAWSLLTVLAFWGCSALIYYFIREPFHSHLASFFCISAILYFWKAPVIKEKWRTLLIGAIAGITAMVRLQDLLILIIPISVALWQKPSFRRSLLRGTIFLMAFFSTFWIQMVVWFTLRGVWLSFPYSNSTFSYWRNPKLLETLFSSNHGLLVWHPVILICLVGLFLWSNPVSRVALICLISELYVVASWYAWSGQNAFGNRFFVGFTPLFVLGLAWIYSTVNRKALLNVVIFLLFLWNICLAFAYLAGVIPHAGEFSWIELFEAVPTLPARVLESISR